MPESPEHTLQETLSRFGSAVKNQRRQLGITQEELAHRSGLHRTYITDIERGARNVTLDSITKLTKALELPLTELFSRLEKKSAGRSLVSVGKAASGRPVDILLVEDNPKHAELTLQALERNGVTNHIIVVRTGDEALGFLLGKRASAPNPRLILLDLTLPGTGGLEVLRKIRADERTKSIPVVILTASRSDRDYKESVKLGVTAYITKPVDFVEFSTVMPKLGFRWTLMEQL